MNELKTAMILRGMRPVDLAKAAGMTAQQINNYLNGGQSIGPKVARIFAQLMNVSEAYLRGVAQSLPVRDFATGEVMACKIMAEEAIEHYGVFYVVDHPEVGPMVVLLADGVQFTTTDWQGAQPESVQEIAEYKWMDAAGRDAIVFDGLPRLFWD